MPVIASDLNLDLFKLMPLGPLESNICADSPAPTVS
jgi:hypothetical protein